MKLLQDAVERAIPLVKEFEGLRLTAYYCPAGVPTIGFGHTATVTDEDVRKGRKITKATAEKLLRDDLTKYGQELLRYVKVEPNVNQLAAFISFAFNVGVQGFRSSTVLKRHNEGDFQSAARAFALWNKATVNGRKVVLPGLTRRRAAEAALYLTPVNQDKDEAYLMPQRVEPERSMAESSIVRAGTIAGGTAALATAAETVGTVARIKDGLVSLDDWLVPVLLLVALAAIGWAVYERLRQRREGWA